MLLIIVFVCALMVIQDGLAVGCVVSESKGRGWLAGLFDGLGDWPNRLGSAVGGATLVQRGFGFEFVLVSFVSVTSVFSTKFATDLSRHIKSSPDGPN